MGCVQGVCEIPAEIVAAETVDHADLVVAEPVDAVFLEVEARVVDEELAYRRLPVGEDHSARPPVVREVQAAQRIAGLLPVEEPQAAIAEVSARVVVHDVEDHGEPVHVAQIDQALQLIGPRDEVGGVERREPCRREHAVDRREVAGGVSRVARVVRHLGRKIVQPGVPESLIVIVLVDRQQLDGRDAEIAQVGKPLDDVEKSSVAGSRVVARGIDSPEHADVELVDDEVADVRRPPAGGPPRIARGGAHDAGAIGKPGAELAGVGIPLEAFGPTFGAADPEQIRRPVVQAIDEARPRSVAERRQPFGSGGRPRRPGTPGCAGGDDIDIARAGCPGPEGDTAVRDSRAHGRVRVDVIEDNSHFPSPADSSVPSPTYADNLPERGARLARREERA